MCQGFCQAERTDKGETAAGGFVGGKDGALDLSGGTGSQDCGPGFQIKRDGMWKVPEYMKKVHKKVVN